MKIKPLGYTTSERGRFKKWEWGSFDASQLNNIVDLLRNRIYITIPNHKPIPVHSFFINPPLILSRNSTYYYPNPKFERWDCINGWTDGPRAVKNGTESK